MTFSDTTSLLTPFFIDNGFSVVENAKDYIRYTLDDLAIYISHDVRDNSIGVFISQRREHVAELTDDVLRGFFGEDSQLRNDDTFAVDLIRFLSDRGKTLLKNDLISLNELKEFTGRKAKSYTDDLIMRQHLRAANDAWAIKDYAEVVKQLDKIPEGSLPPGYRNKYQFAIKKKGY